jgi:hypothetical protein
MENGLQRQVMLCSDLEDVKMALEASAKSAAFYTGVSNFREL